MLLKIVRTMDRIGMVGQAQAHCDIPCGIYDPQPALIAAVSVVRLIDIITESEEQNWSITQKAHFVARSTATKEQEAERIKHEVRVIWGDYFKGAVLDKYPEASALAHSIMVKASACKQDLHRDDALELVELVNQFAELFWKSKGVDCIRRISGYAPNLPVAYPELDPE